MAANSHHYFVFEKAIYCYDYKPVQDRHFWSAENDIFVKKTLKLGAVFTK